MGSTKDKAAEILADVCFKYSVKPGRAPGASDILDDGPSWTLKANVTGMFLTIESIIAIMIFTTRLA